MPVGDGHGGDLRPDLRYQRSRARGLRQLDGRRREEAQPLQEILLPRTADHLRQPGGTDVGAFLDDAEHAELRAVVVHVLDAEPAPVEGRVSIIVLGVTRPRSIACEAAKILKVEPSS